MWMKQAKYLEMKENVLLSLQKYPFTRHLIEEKDHQDQGAWTRSTQHANSAAVELTLSVFPVHLMGNVVG